MKEKLIEIIKREEIIDKYFENPHDILELELEEMGLSSIAYIKLLVLLETEFDIEFPDEYLQLYTFKSIQAIIDYISSIKEKSAMKDGYYLSTYLHISGLAYCYHISARHNHNCSLWKKCGNQIKLVHFWELERLTGQKHHAHSFYSYEHAKEFLNDLLSTYNLSLEDMVEVWGTPGLETTRDYYFPDDSKKFAYHNIAHLFSAILSDVNIFNNNPVIGLSLDGGPDNVVDFEIKKKKHFIGSYSVNGEIIDYFSVYSPGPLWNAAKEQFGMEEGSLMALASASESRVNYPIDELVLCDDMKSTYKAIVYVKKLIGEISSLTDQDAGVKFNGYDQRFSKKDNNISMIMKIIQQMSIEIMKLNIDMIIKKYNVIPEESFLSIAGGYALNCPSNSSIMNQYNFKGFYTVPCVSDSGISMGIALYTFFKRMGKFDFKLGHAFYGDSDSRDLLKTLKQSGMEPFIKSLSEWEEELAVKDVINSPIVWFDGQAEIRNMTGGGENGFIHQKTWVNGSK